MTTKKGRFTAEDGASILKGFLAQKSSPFRKLVRTKNVFRFSLYDDEKVRNDFEATVRTMDEVRAEQKARDEKPEPEPTGKPDEVLQYHIMVNDVDAPWGSDRTLCSIDARNCRAREDALTLLDMLTLAADSGFSYVYVEPWTRRDEEQYGSHS